MVCLASLFWPQGGKLNFPADHEGSHKHPADLLIASPWLMITPPFPTFTSHLGVWDKLTWPLVSCDHWTNYHGDDIQSWVTASPPGSSQSHTITRLFVITLLHKLKIFFFLATISSCYTSVSFTRKLYDAKIVVTHSTKLWAAYTNLSLKNTNRIALKLISQ